MSKDSKGPWDVTAVIRSTRPRDIGTSVDMPLATRTDDVGAIGSLLAALTDRSSDWTELLAVHITASRPVYNEDRCLSDPIGARAPCTRWRNHKGLHENVTGDTWQDSEGKANDQG